MYQKYNICNSVQILLLSGNGLWFMYQKYNICNSAQILLLLGNALCSFINLTTHSVLLSPILPTYTLGLKRKLLFKFAQNLANFVYWDIILRNFDLAKKISRNPFKHFFANFRKKVTPNSCCFHEIFKNSNFWSAQLLQSYIFTFAKTFGNKIFSRKSAKTSCRQNTVQSGPLVSHINDRVCLFVINLRKFKFLRKLSYFSFIFASNFSWTCDKEHFVSTLIQTQQCHYCYFPTTSK